MFYHTFFPKIFYGLFRNVQNIEDVDLSDQTENQLTPMDVDSNCNEASETNSQIPMQDSDTSEPESEEENIDFDDDFLLDDPEIGFEQQCSSTSDFPTLSNYFLDLQFGSFTDKQRAIITKVFNLIIENRFEQSIPFVHLSKLAVGFLSIMCDDDDDDTLLEKAIEFAKSRPLQNSYISMIGKRIAPQPVKIGSFTYYYVPLIDQLKMLLQNSSILESIRNEQQSPPIDSFSAYESDLTSSRRPYLMGKARIEFGADDFCIVKAIGPRATHQKFFAFYMTLTNIPFKYRLKRENMKIVLIANRHQMKKNNISINMLLKRLRDDLYFALTHGVDVETNTSGHSSVVNVPVAFSGFLGDNKGTYEMLGLSESFSRGFVCRACMSSRADIEKNLDFRLLGTAKDLCDYQLKVSRLKIDKNNWGIKSPYVFGDLPGVNIFNSCPFDVLHDLPQGVIPRLFPLILWYSGSRLSFKNLIIKVEAFELYHGFVTFTTAKKLKGTAVQV